MSSQCNHFPAFEAKMRVAGTSEAAIRAFRGHYENLLTGQTGMIPEASIRAVRDLPRYEQLPAAGSNPLPLLKATMILKLNGGLGTSMGLDRAKSLLQVKDDLTFLDVIARHVLHLRQAHGMTLPFLLMNSFSTSADTLEFLRKYADLGPPAELELLQNQVPKVDAENLAPVSWPANPQLEWCPPGHGDIYPALLGSGWLERLINQGIRYLFVSNADNLGASLDLALLQYFADSGNSFVMEVAERTAADRKGGHLAVRGERFLLRESAQCPAPDESAFQDITLHRFFNTNNLWIRLDHLSDTLKAHGGFIPLPMIRNSKTVDPRDKHSPKVIQLESAMGAAIEAFEHSGAVVVPRQRFAPVKTTSDLLAIRSDAYEITPDWRVQLASPAAGVQPPSIDLDPEAYKLVDQLDRLTKAGVPSLRLCRQLAVQGPVEFSADVRFRGAVKVINPRREPRRIQPGDYEDCEVAL